jgi:hypothetical protein
MLTEAGVKTAIDDSIAMLRRSVEAYKAGDGEYESLSARDVLVRLGLGWEDARQVLTYCAANGFEYCLDPAIECSSGESEKHSRIYPPEFACVWGADQLLSRLRCVR